MTLFSFGAFACSPLPSPPSPPPIFPSTSRSLTLLISVAPRRTKETVNPVLTYLHVVSLAAQLIGFLILISLKTPHLIHLSTRSV